MTTRSDALHWLQSHYGSVTGHISTSKYYKSEESWTGHPVWWIQIPIDYIKNNLGKSVHMLCQISPNQIEYYYLKVPVVYLIDKLPKLDVVKNQVVLHLSAEKTKLFVDQRRNSLVPFDKFLVSNKTN
jgi:hypothetical protein